MNDRLQQVLRAVVEGYVDMREPVSSGFLARRFDNAWSPATMRNDLAELEDEGYVRKMYCSSGSVPTNKAYQFLVSEVLDLAHAPLAASRGDGFPTLGDAVRFLSAHTGSLSVLIDEDMHFVLDGIEELFSQPDFSTPGEYRTLARIVDEIEDRREFLFREFVSRKPSIHVGAIDKMRIREVDTSSFIGSAQTADGRRTVCVLVGPVRMHYAENWNAFSAARGRLAKSRPRVA